jgi:hypothetical protein
VIESAGRVVATGLRAPDWSGRRRPRIFWGRIVWRSFAHSPRRGQSRMALSLGRSPSLKISEWGALGQTHSAGAETKGERVSRTGPIPAFSPRAHGIKIGGVSAVNCCGFACYNANHEKPRQLQTIPTSTFPASNAEKERGYRFTWIGQATEEGSPFAMTRTL